MASTSSGADRATKLNKLFQDVVRGKRDIPNASIAKLFFESIKAQSSPSTCVEIITTSASGLGAIRAAVRSDLSQAFLLEQVLPFVDYMAEPTIKTLACGSFLHQLLETIVDPPTVWCVLLDLFMKDGLSSSRLQSFAWLLAELLDSNAEYSFDLVEHAQNVMSRDILLQADDLLVRECGYKIQKLLAIRGSTSRTPDDLMSTPGGRHDNDFEDFRNIAIYPTKDEILSTTTPFYLTMDEVFSTELAQRATTHIDNQFRLLREDMLKELRDDLQVTHGKRRGNMASSKLGQLVPVSIDSGDDPRSKKCSLGLHCGTGLEDLIKRPTDQRKKFLDNHRSFLKHQAFGALCSDDGIIGFAFIERNIRLLVLEKPIVCLQFVDNAALQAALVALPSQEGIYFMLVNTPVFAYEPVLRSLKSLVDLPFTNELFNTGVSETQFDSTVATASFVAKLKNAVPNEAGLVAVPKHHYTLDNSQRDSITYALSSAVTLIQGPPGTGKSFVGAQIAKYITMLSKQRILVISYTNLALDQFLEDLLDIGIPANQIVRLGSKFTTRTNPLMLSNIDSLKTRDRSFWNAIDLVRNQRRDLVQQMNAKVVTLCGSHADFADIMEFLEFSENGYDFFEAFEFEQDGDFRIVGKDGKEAKADHVFEEWRDGKSRSSVKIVSDSRVWQMDAPDRLALVRQWKEAIITERAANVAVLSGQIDALTARIDKLMDQNKVATLRARRIVGCTTTAAAMYTDMIRQVEPDVVLVEEAGEILECHILTALAPSVKQMILIGDHKQLPPKIANHKLSIAKGDGFDLNLSLFERLINHGLPHITLRKQHRMHPEIAAYPRALTYPDLLDDKETQKRARVKGLQSRVCFVHHEHAEGDLRNTRDRHDPDVKATKQNDFEAKMVLKTVRYLGQQGYTTSNMVVLTPYLGQLRKLVEELGIENDPILNDLDHHDMLRAGLMTPAAAQVDKRPLRISTIDNYQGEESDIVIASLTRSNSEGDIGFLAAPERLNVLLSRARCGIILLGNMHTFMSSKKGRCTWHPFFKLLRESKSLYDGVPIRCEQHPDRTAVISAPEDFARCCPDGGCAEQCGHVLSCGIHKCVLRCHRTKDHSQIQCNAPISKICERQHKRRTTCSKQSDGCRDCAREDEDTKRRLERDLALEKERLKRQQAYSLELQQIEDEIDHHKRTIQHIQEVEKLKSQIAQQKGHASALKDTSQKLQDVRQDKPKNDDKSPSATAGANSLPSQTAVPSSWDVQSEAYEEWKMLKDEGAQNAAMDQLMKMSGLELVKQEFLNIKTKVDTAVRQELELSTQRFSCSLLGNPGTGKTTVARLYAEFLGTVGVLPGACSKETTGAALSHAGINGCQTLIDEILNEGGGVLFIDEAYQMTSGNSFGGKAVLDFLLPEVENLTGKIVFVLAGYDKDMESFFAHNPGLPSRFPITMKFEDYTDHELLHILQMKIHKQYNGRMQCEDGTAGLFCRIVAKRVGRGRGQRGFGNARTVENVLAQVSRRQVIRLTKERRAKKVPDDFLFTKGDLIGPEPSGALKHSTAWKNLQQLIGLQMVKDAVQGLVDTLQQNYARELAEEPITEYSLNKVFLGNPGTGKTTVAKLYGKILAELDMLSRGEVVLKNPSDFVGAALGQSEQQTKGILEAATGKVLVIDEAYGLYGGSSNDPYKTGVIDTIVANVQSVPGDDRCVLLLGYKDELETMMQNVNPGLSRRFPLASAFVFDDFSDDDLRKILDLKLRSIGYQATDQAKTVVKDMLCRARNRPNFGNAGEIDILLDVAKAQHQKRLSSGATDEPSRLEAIDFDEDFDRAVRADTDVRRLFLNTVGCDNIVKQLEEYQATVKTLKRLDMDPREGIPFNFLFRGPPGTGKTTTAKKMGKVFYDMGFLAKAEVVECSTTDIIGQYVGQTGPKVQQMMDKALGKVLFIDEAYRLADGHFAQEAMDEIVDCVTKPRYMNKMVIILAGYEQDINRLMQSNPGLTSRFPSTIDFHSLTPEECFSLLRSTLQMRFKDISAKRPTAVIRLDSLVTPSAALKTMLTQTFFELSQQSGWASARDVLVLAKTVYTKTLQALGPLPTQEPIVIEVREDTVVKEITALLEERKARSTAVNTTRNATLNSILPLSAPETLTLKASHTDTVIDTKFTEAEPPTAVAPVTVDGSNGDHTRQSSQVAKRDAGVTDAVWNQLQSDIEAAKKRDENFVKLKASKDTATGEARAKILELLIEEERLREEEARKRERVARMGQCPMGYNWIKQATGYRCAGGSHFIGDSDLQ